MTQQTKRQVTILYGGRSGEHEVSLLSAASVARNLNPQANQVRLVGVSKDGAWYLQEEAELEACRAGATALSLSENPLRRVSVVPGGGAMGALVVGPEARPLPTDVVFPVLHGTFGEDGTIQGLFEMACLPYVGAGVLGSAIGMDKEIAKALWIKAGLPVVPYLSIRSSAWADQSDRARLIEEAESQFGYPLFVKPVCAGSSVGAGKALSREELTKAVEAALRWDDKALVEPFISAKEIECSVTGNDFPVAYTPGEIVPTHEFYDYDAKYIDPDGAALLIPAKISPDQSEEIRRVAVRAYRCAELTGLARVDFFMRKDTGEILLNEVNTMPGFTTISMFPKMCGAAGLGYPDLLDLLISHALERWAVRSGRDYSRFSQ